MERSRALLAQALVLVAIVAGCQPTATLPVAPAAIVDLGDEVAAAKGEGGVVSVLVGTSDRVHTITSGPGSPGRPTVNMLSYSGTGDEWNTFVYGSAVPGTTRVEIQPSGGVGGQVVDGAWLVVLRDEDLSPNALHWRMLDAAGVELRSGDGVLTHDD